MLVQVYVKLAGQTVCKGHEGGRQAVGAISYSNSILLPTVTNCRETNRYHRASSRTNRPVLSHKPSVKTRLPRWSLDQMSLESGGHCVPPTSSDILSILQWEWQLAVGDWPCALVALTKDLLVQGSTGLAQLNPWPPPQVQRSHIYFRSAVTLSDHLSFPPPSHSSPLICLSLWHPQRSTSFTASGSYG